MKGLEVNLDGVKYFVTVEAQLCEHVDLVLYLNTMRSKPIYTETIPPMDVNKFDMKKAKQFIKRALLVK